MATIAPLVAQHYNSIQEKGIEARKESRIYFMRSFNNWIKSMLISSTISRLSEEASSPGRKLMVLDMCCGKGGDIQKWLKSQAVKHVLFADIAEQSVDQCRERYSQSAQRNRDIFSAEFITMDCTKDSLKEKLKNPMLFDLVSVQFSFHYSFESLSQAMKMLQNISENLAPGGWFIGTTPNANRIVKHLRSAAPSTSFGNDVYRINFESEEPFPIFGAKYYFQLDEVVNCPEFLVNFPTLETLAARFGLKLMFKHNFDEYFRMSLAQGKFLLDRMQALETYPPRPPATSPSFANPTEYAEASSYLESHPDAESVGTLSKSEWETVSLYLVFGFRKE